MILNAPTPAADTRDQANLDWIVRQLKKRDEDLAVWRALWEFGAAGSTWGASFLGDCGLNGWQTAAVGATKTFRVMTLNVDDYAIPGYTTLIRAIATFSCNPTAPAITFDAGIYTITTVGGAAGTLSWGGVASVSRANFTNPPASTISDAEGPEVELVNSTSNNFMIGVNPSGTAAANHIAVLTVQVQMRWLPA